MKQPTYELEGKYSYFPVLISNLTSTKHSTSKKFEQRKTRSSLSNTETKIHSNQSQIHFLIHLDQLIRQNRVQQLKKQLLQMEYRSKKHKQQQQIINTKIDKMAQRNIFMKNLIHEHEKIFQQKYTHLRKIQLKLQNKSNHIQKQKEVLKKDLQHFQQVTKNNTLNKVKLKKVEIPLYIHPDYPQNIILQSIKYEVSSQKQNKIANWSIIMLMLKTNLIGQILGVSLPYQTDIVHRHRWRIGLKSFRIDEALENLVEEIGGFVQVNIDKIMSRMKINRQKFLNISSQQMNHLCSSTLCFPKRQPHLMSHMVQSKLDRVAQIKRLSLHKKHQQPQIELYTNKYAQTGVFQVLDFSLESQQQDDDI